MIVGFGHVKRVGKDSAAAALSRDLGFTQIAFADKLKQLALKANPIVSGDIQTTNVGAGHGRLDWCLQGMGGWERTKDVYKEAREFLQRLGVGAREVFGEDFWVDQTFGNLDPTKDYVVSDVRFVNEAEAVKAAGGVVIRIDRPGYEAYGHVSETALADYDGWDAVINNTGSIQDFEQEVLKVVEGLRK